MDFQNLVTEYGYMRRRRPKSFLGYQPGNISTNHKYLKHRKGEIWGRRWWCPTETSHGAVVCPRQLAPSRVELYVVGSKNVVHKR